MVSVRSLMRATTSEVISAAGIRRARWRTLRAGLPNAIRDAPVPLPGPRRARARRLLAPAVARADDARIIVHHRAGLDAAERADIRAERADGNACALPNAEVVCVTEARARRRSRSCAAIPASSTPRPTSPVQAVDDRHCWTRFWGMFDPARRTWTPTSTPSRRGRGPRVRRGSHGRVGLGTGGAVAAGSAGASRPASTPSTDTSDTAGHGASPESWPLPRTTARASWTPSRRTRPSARSRSSRAPTPTSRTSPRASAYAGQQGIRINASSAALARRPR